MDGVKRILANPQVSRWHLLLSSAFWNRLLLRHFVFQCLPDPNNYHEFCRLLARLKSNYQLGELVKVENYPEVIRLIANFTVTSLQVGSLTLEPAEAVNPSPHRLCPPLHQHWEFAPNSVHYLLSLWQRLAASVPYVKATEPHLLETYTPEVTKAYITSRLESVHVILRSELLELSNMSDPCQRFFLDCWQLIVTLIHFLC